MVRLQSWSRNSEYSHAPSALLVGRVYADLKSGTMLLIRITTSPTASKTRTLRSFNRRAVSCLLFGDCSLQASNSPPLEALFLFWDQEFFSGSLFCFGANGRV